MAEEEGANLEYTATWIVAAVCSVIILISLAAERFLHYLGKTLKKKGQKPLYEALLKVKEELMLLGFISLLLTVFQGVIQDICIPAGWNNHMLPCKKEAEHVGATTADFVAGIGRRLLADSVSEAGHCQSKGKVPLMSLEAIHQLHIFIFFLAVINVVFSGLTMLFGGIKIRQWKHWEDEIEKKDAGSGPRPITPVRESEFIKQHFKGFDKDSTILSWVRSFCKQFYGSVTKSDYTTMRLGFIMTHCPGNPRFDFHKSMMRAFEADFKKVVGIRRYLWILVVLFMLLNVYGWHIYFWIGFIPLILLLAVGTKLEHVITRLAHEVAEKHSVVEGDVVVKPSDEHFWFRRPRIILHLIHFILFANSFEIALYLWILTTYGIKSCIMGDIGFVIPTLVLRILVQHFCSYSTLPLYAIVTQMGTHFKKSVFEERVQEGLLGWVETAKERTRRRVGNANPSGSSTVSTEPSVTIEMSTVDEEIGNHTNENTSSSSEVNLQANSNNGEKC